jgi:hypothetical protein
MADENVEVTDGLQDLVVADLSVIPPKTTRLTVGYRPRDVRINGAEDRVVVVGESDVTLIDLGASPVTSGYIPLGDGDGRDVSFDDALEHALVRREMSDEVDVLNLDDASKDFSIAFDGPVTDLDLLASGLGTAVVRSKSELIVFHLEDILVDSTNYESVMIPGEIFGSSAISPTESCAVLYTNATNSTRVQLVNLTEGADYLKVRTLDTTNPVYSVVVGPDGQHAVATAGTSSGPGNAFSVLNLAEVRFPRIVGTAGPIKETLVGSDVVLVTAGPSAEAETTLVGLPGLGLTRLPLASSPLRAGLLPELDMAYVAQSHSEGRLTFYGLENLADGDVSVQTVTGFELSADVVKR